MSGDQELTRCSICGHKSVVERKYYYYDINCECCNGKHHFEIVRYCSKCKPEPPLKVIASVKPIVEKNEKS